MFRFIKHFYITMPKFQLGKGWEVREDNPSLMGYKFM